jgi:ribosome biogenesis protein Nip4
MIIFRLSTSEEFNLVKDAIDSLFGEKVADYLIQNKKLIIGEGKWKEVFLVSDELFVLFDTIIDKKQPYSLGMQLGDLDKSKKFKLSLEGLFEVAKYTSHKIKLTEHGTQHLTYGRDLPFSATEKLFYETKKDDYVILLDQNGYPIGFGKILHDFEEIQKTPSKVWIKNLQDIGWYLRKGQ